MEASLNADSKFERGDLDAKCALFECLKCRVQFSPVRFVTYVSGRSLKSDNYAREAACGLRFRWLPVTIPRARNAFCIQQLRY